MPLYRVELNYTIYVQAESPTMARRHGDFVSLNTEGDELPNDVFVTEATLESVTADDWFGCIPYNTEDDTPAEHLV